MAVLVRTSAEHATLPPDSLATATLCTEVLLQFSQEFVPAVVVATKVLDLARSVPPYLQQQHQGRQSCARRQYDEEDDRCA